VSVSPTASLSPRDVHGANLPGERRDARLVDHARGDRREPGDKRHDLGRGVDLHALTANESEEANMRRVLLLGLLGAAAVLPQQALAATYTLKPVADGSNHVQGVKGWNGTAPVMRECNFSGNSRVSECFMRFDLAGVPGGAVQSATLTLTPVAVKGTLTGSVDLDPIDGNWNEATGGDPFFFCWPIGGGSDCVFPVGEASATWVKNQPVSFPLDTNAVVPGSQLNLKIVGSPLTRIATREDPTRAPVLTITTS
jgi:hypothetical protein